MTLNSKTVLVVDDEPVLRTIVREILHEEGYAVIEAADGRVMLEIMARGLPGLALPGRPARRSGSNDERRGAAYQVGPVDCGLPAQALRCRPVGRAGGPSHRPSMLAPR